MRKLLWHAAMGFLSSIIKSACAMFPRGTPRQCYLPKCAKHELEIDRGVACANSLFLYSTLSPFSCYKRAPIDAPRLQARYSEELRQSSWICGTYPAFSSLPSYGTSWRLTRPLSSGVGDCWSACSSVGVELGRGGAGLDDSPDSMTHRLDLCVSASFDYTQH